jgi:hypothetical protein
MSRTIKRFVNEMTRRTGEGEGEEVVKGLHAEGFVHGDVTDAGQSSLAKGASR